MFVCFRADASPNTGTGHLVRCLTLAESLHQRGAYITFFCRHLSGVLGEQIREKGFDFLPLNTNSGKTIPPEEIYLAQLGVPQHKDAEDVRRFMLTLHTIPDWVVVDHYALDESWERILRPHCKHMMVIDDLANRQHDCDLLLDQNLYEEGENPYQDWVPPKCHQLVGPRFALLRPQFARARKETFPRKGPFNRILVFFGGSDLANNTLKAVKALQSLRRDIQVDIIPGFFYPYRDELEAVCRDWPFFKIHDRVENMAELIVKADLALGCPGSTTWERMSLGLPALTVISADNQRRMATAAHQNGVLMHLGEEGDISIEDWKSALQSLHDDPQGLNTLSTQGMQLVDGLGADRVAEILMTLT